MMAISMTVVTTAFNQRNLSRDFFNEGVSRVATLDQIVGIILDEAPPSFGMIWLLCESIPCKAHCIKDLPFSEATVCERESQLRDRLIPTLFSCLFGKALFQDFGVTIGIHSVRKVTLNDKPFAREGERYASNPRIVWHRNCRKSQQSMLEGALPGGT